MDRQQECKICNKHVVRLAQHVRQAHDMNMVDTETESIDSSIIENSEASEIETEDASSSEDESASDENMSTREESDSDDEAKQTILSSC